MQTDTVVVYSYVILGVDLLVIMKIKINIVFFTKILTTLP